MKRQCPHCGCTRAAAALDKRRECRVGDYIVCAGCERILRLNEAEQPVATTDEEIRSLTGQTWALVTAAKMAVRLVNNRAEVMKKAQLN